MPQPTKYTISQLNLKQNCDCKVLHEQINIRPTKSKIKQDKQRTGLSSKNNKELPKGFELRSLEVIELEVRSPREDVNFVFLPNYMFI